MFLITTWHIFFSSYFSPKIIHFKKRKNIDYVWTFSEVSIYIYIYIYSLFIYKNSSGKILVGLFYFFK